MSAVIAIDEKIRAKKLLEPHLSDIGNGERLLALYGQDLRYNVPQKRWYRWNGTTWRADEKREIEHLAKSAMRELFRIAGEMKDDADRRKLFANHAIKSERNASVKAMIERAGAEPGIPVLPSEFDSHPMLFNCGNGVIDLTTGELKPHDRALLHTKFAPVDYNESATCPRWLQFLERIFDGKADLIGYIQRAVGYSLTGATSEQCLHLLHGTGANGKSTFLEVLAELMGDYALQADFTSFLDKKSSDGPRNDIARLAGARLVRSSEIGEGKRFNEALIKALTGSETISARFLYAETFEFEPTFKLWFAANHKPVIRGTDHAIWRRVRLIPFTVTIPDAERDEGLPAALRAELSGILTWAVQGCLEWRASGLKPPAEVMAATDAYRTESDVLGAFIEDCCVLDMLAETPSSDLYAAYRRWAKDGGEFELSQTAFGRRLEERGLIVHKTRSAKMRRGIRLHDSAKPKGEELF